MKRVTAPGIAAMTEQRVRKGLRTRQAILEFVHATPGCDIGAVAAHVGRTTVQAAKYLHALVADGQIAQTRIAGGKVQYGAPGAIAVQPSRAELVGKMLAAAGDAGVSLAELMQALSWSECNASNAMQRMRAKGLVVSARKRWFAPGVTPKPRPAPAPKRVAAPKAEKPPRLEPLPVKTRPPVAAKPSPRYPAPTGEVIVPPHVKPELCKSVNYDLRYQLPPDTKVVGGFRSMGIGRYLDGVAA